MAEENKIKIWLVAALIPVCVIVTVLATKSLLSNKPAAASRFTEEYSGGDEVASVGQEEAEPPEPEPVETTNRWGQAGSGGAAHARPAAGADAGPAGGAATAASPAVKAADPAAAAMEAPKKQWGFGATYGALLGAVSKSINNPATVRAMFNNKYVVEGFMSRALVKKITGDPLTLANYLKNPAIINKHMGKPAVQAAMNNPAVVDAFFSSKLVEAMLDTPGVKALMKDPATAASIVAANPALVNVLTNPNVLNAVVNNPRTAELVGQIGLGQ